MSILIKGMEMPTTCCHCPLMGYDPDIEWNDGGRETQGAYICVMTHELIDNTKREDHCPLVEIQPHGRLIDADALMGVIRAHDYPLKAHFNSTDNGMFTIGIQQAVDEAPTIIEEER